MASLTEKRINRVLNLLLRWPFQFLATYIIISNLVTGRVSVSPVELTLMLIGGFFHAANAFYYCDKVKDHTA